MFLRDLTPWRTWLLALSLVLACSTGLASGQVGPAVRPLAASAVHAPPPPLQLRYVISGQVSIIPYQTDGALSWKHDSKNYEASMTVHLPLLGSRVQTSQGRITAAGLQPLRFVDRVRKDRSVEFDYEQALIRFSEGASPEPLTSGAQDHLSVFIQVASLIAAQPWRYPRGTEFALPAMGIYGPESWRFVVSGEETLALPGGEQRTLKIMRPPAHGDDPGAEVWLAPALGWLPARIRLSQPNGDYVDQQWRASEAP